MNYIFEAIVDGSLKDFGVGAIISIISILMVFAILGLIILITWGVNIGINYFEVKFPKKESVTEENESVPQVDLSDEDATVAVLVASIDYRNETKQNVKVLSVKEIK